MKFETLAIRSGYDPKSAQGAMNPPIYQTTAYDFGSCETAANRFALKELGQIYSRLTNPSTDILEGRIAALEEGAAALAVASGQAAIFYALANLAACGENIIIAEKIYGGSTTLICNTMKRFGIEARVFDSESVSDLEALIDDKTRAIFFETLSNPQISIPNIDQIVAIANKHGVVTVADNTVATPVIYRPLTHGVDVVVHSASKYISGQGVSIAGLIVSSKTLNAKLVANPRYAHFNEPDESYHGLVFADLAGAFDIFCLRIRIGLLRDIGATLSPFNAWQLTNSLETLSVRVKAHSHNALQLARFLSTHAKVKSVNYPALPNSPHFDFVRRYFTEQMASGLLCFDVGSREVAAKVMNSVKLFSIVVNIGDTKSIITHPASTTHQQLSSEQLASAGISEGLIRISVGLENAEDLIDDLANALA